MFKMPLIIKTASRAGLVIAPFKILGLFNYDPNLLYAVSTLAALHDLPGD